MTDSLINFQTCLVLAAWQTIERILKQSKTEVSYSSQKLLKQERTMYLPSPLLCPSQPLPWQIYTVMEGCIYFDIKK